MDIDSALMLELELLAEMAEEKAAILELNEKLHAWQQTADSPEQLATLPVLDLSEVSPDPMLLHTEETEMDGATVLYHKAATNGIVHLNYYFRLTDCSLEELCALKGIGALLGSAALWAVTVATTLYSPALSATKVNDDSPSTASLSSICHL